MAKYYGVQRSEEYLVHYGIKGMKWGVRKAIESGNREALAKHYGKATQKLKKLKWKANRTVQKQNAKDSLAAGAALTGLGAAGLAGSYGIVKGQISAQKALGAKRAQVLVPVGLVGTSALSAAGGLGLMGSGVASAYRASKHGNKKAIAKYNRFRKEMNQAFKGTNTARMKRDLARIEKERARKMAASNSIFDPPSVNEAARQAMVEVNRSKKRRKNSK